MTQPIEFDLAARMREVVALDPAAEALSFGGRWRTWGYLRDGIDAIDGHLRNIGIGEHEAVGIIMRNRPEVVTAAIAMLATRRCVVTLSSVIPAANLAAEVERMRLGAVIASESDWERPGLLDAARGAGSLGLGLTDGLGGVEITVHSEFVAGEHHEPRPGVAVQMLTSGTTGPPKRVDLPYRSLEQEMIGAIKYSPSAAAANPAQLRQGAAICWTPILHIAGLRALMTAVVEGRRIALLEKFDVEQWVSLVEEHRPKSGGLPPTAMRMVLDAKVAKERLSSLKAVLAGTAPVPPALKDQFEQTYDIPVLVVYGATEFAGGVAGWTIKDWRAYGDTKRGSTGRANDGIELRIVDPATGAVLAPGEQGVLEVAGEQLPVDGWLRTTDLARLDADGFLFIDGRVDDVIIRGGFKVFTSAVRDIVMSHPSVRDAAVFGVDDERLGQVPVAAVELRPDGPAVSAAELTAFLKERLSAYQVPVELLVLDELPRTPSMKVSQPALRPLFGQRTASPA
ncbi:MAG: class I adenylate-forming enzyme family protein [Acidimicrobiia bacterium]